MAAGYAPDSAAGHEAFPLPLAAVWTRGAAIVIDSVVLALAGWAMRAAAGELRGGLLLLFVLLSLTYYIVAEALAGAGVGKLAMGLRVVALNGARISWPQSAVRNVLRAVDGLVYPSYLVGFLAATASPARQRIGDRLAGTVVVRSRTQPVTRPPRGSCSTPPACGCT